jgi:hypothetical protein
VRIALVLTGVAWVVFGLFAGAGLAAMVLADPTRAGGPIEAVVVVAAAAAISLGVGAASFAAARSVAPGIDGFAMVIGALACVAGLWPLGLVILVGCARARGDATEPAAPGPPVDPLRWDEAF